MLTEKSGQVQVSHAQTSVATVCRILWTGGVQRVAIAQHLGLLQHGYDASLLFVRSTPGTSYDLPGKARVVYAQLPTNRRFGKLFAAITSVFASHRGRDATVDLDLLWSLRRRLRSYDIVTYNDQYAGLVGIFNRLFFGKAYVLILHEFFPRVSSRWNHRLAFIFADLIDAISIISAPAILTISGRISARLERIVPGRVFLARNGCEPDLQVSAKSKDFHTVLSLSVWDRGRRPEVYLDVARRLPQYQFIIAGMWPDQRYFKEFTEMSRELPNVRVTGALSEERRKDLLRSCLIYLRFGFDESGPGMGGLEALAEGAIVIANKGLGISEIVTDGVDGLICDSPTCEDAVKAIQQVERMASSKVEKISEAARALCANHSWELHVSTLIEALHRANYTVNRHYRINRSGRS